MTRKLILAVLALAPAAALTQAPALEAARGVQRTVDEGAARRDGVIDAATGEGTAVSDGEVRVAPLEGGASAADAGRGTVPPPDTYTVRPGDTLWDLSGRFLNNPWYWPKVWSYNPEITNPHWIEPGNVLRLYASAEEGPARVEPLPAGISVDDAGEAEEELAVAPRQLEDLSRADMREPPSVEEQETVSVSGPYKIGYVPPRTPWAVRSTFVTPRELAESGAITAAFEEKLLLSTRDRAYATFKTEAQVKPGETYVIYKMIQPVVHPSTKELVGYQSNVLGAGRVLAVDDKAVTLVITTSLDPIERGALLGPWTERLYRPVPPKPNSRSLEGVIIGSPTAQLTQLAETQVVFIDRGSAHGVEEGNHFTVVRSGDPYGRSRGQLIWDPRLPKEDVGELLVVDVKETASAALVTRSLTELEAGDRIEMRAAASAAR